jgi:hypothetical protein
MKIVKEYLYEKFIEDSDPISDMGIGYKPLIDKLEARYKYFNQPEEKDYVRIRSIINKSKGDKEKEKMFARNMVKAINDFRKSYRRYKAAEEIGGLDWEVTQIFLLRALELNNITR